jgi:hypothetical protein
MWIAGYGGMKGVCTIGPVTFPLNPAHFRSPPPGGTFKHLLQHLTGHPIWVITYVFKQSDVQAPLLEGLLLLRLRPLAPASDSTTSAGELTTSSGELTTSAGVLATSATAGPGLRPTAKSSVSAPDTLTFAFTGLLAGFVTGLLTGLLTGWLTGWLIGHPGRGGIEPQNSVKVRLEAS